MGLLDDLKIHYSTDGFERKLIYWNVGIFILSIIFFYDFKGNAFDYPDWIFLSSNLDVLLRNPWTILTYAAFHNTFMHLAFNMLVLNFSGRLFLTFFTKKQLLGFYILSAIFAGIIFTAVNYIIGKDATIIGASGAIMAILIAAATYQPSMYVRFLFIGNVKLWHFAALLLLLDIIYVFIENPGGHVAHLAGAFFGFAYVKLLRSGIDLSVGISVIFDKLAQLFGQKEKTPFKKVHRNYDRKPEKKVSKIVTKDKSQQQIDDILDKISRSGYDSLTAEEKEFLFKAGKQ
ncbi:MAG TPA: rhomboid family intramembrane serine protease [Flavobacterium sp.]|nr:rhomboid family intramembrane serine protease [Flavobacterium sp.]